MASLQGAIEWCEERFHRPATNGAVAVATAIVVVLVWVVWLLVWPTSPAPSEPELSLEAELLQDKVDDLTRQLENAQSLNSRLSGDFEEELGRFDQKLEEQPALLAAGLSHPVDTLCSLYEAREGDRIGTAYELATRLRNGGSKYLEFARGLKGTMELAGGWMQILAPGVSRADLDACLDIPAFVADLKKGKEALIATTFDSEAYQSQCVEGYQGSRPDSYWFCFRGRREGDGTLSFATWAVGFVLDQLEPMTKTTAEFVPPIPPPVSD